MKTFYSLNKFLKYTGSKKKFIVTIGVFDGIHRAHQKIIKTLVKKSKKTHSKSLLITFDPHPVNVLSKSKKIPLLISLKHRLSLLQDLGLDYVIVLSFTKKLSRISAERFIENIFGKIKTKEIVVGSNFFFGKKREGSLKVLKKFSKDYGYTVSTVGRFKTSGKIISSTLIRGLILDGKLKKASLLLSRPVTVLGTVVKGHRRGRDVGFPTANVDPHHEAIPPSGVYAVRVKIGNRLYKGILNRGLRPTFIRGEKEPTIEVHVFDFKKDIYGKDIEIIFVKKIRNEKKFKDINKLRRRIKEDIKRVKYILR